MKNETLCITHTNEESGGYVVVIATWTTRIGISELETQCVLQVGFYLWPGVDPIPTHATMTRAGSTSDVISLVHWRKVWEYALSLGETLKR